jgi:hypothetical protein
MISSDALPPGVNKAPDCLPTGFTGPLTLPTKSGGVLPPNPNVTACSAGSQVSATPTFRHCPSVVIPKQGVPSLARRVMISYQRCCDLASSPIEIREALRPSA